MVRVEMRLGEQTLADVERAIIDDQTQALFVEVFGGGRVVDGRYEPLTLDGVKKALRLPDDDPDAAPALA